MKNVGGATVDAPPRARSQRRLRNSALDNAADKEDAEQRENNCGPQQKKCA
jgi:hypothetical protein